MEVTLCVRPEAAQALHHRRPTTSQARELLTVAAELGVTLAPVHPGADDMDSMQFFAVSVPDPAAAEQTRQRFAQCAAVKGAFIKPHDEPPKTKNRDLQK